MPGIIVGVDGSDNSRRALGWAIREAAQRQLPLEVMTVEPDPVRPATGIYWGVHPENSFKPELARKSLQEFADNVASEVGGTVPEITVSVATGEVAEELIKASRDADLLVVGSRGSGGFTRLLLGSTSSQVTHHAACPVVVIPGTHQAAGPK
ncbi:MAG: universal stress protein [Streptosporangiaceae bacterium]|jgi:nucleotide-binding universal stress UspA family protein